MGIVDFSKSIRIVHWKFSPSAGDWPQSLGNARQFLYRWVICPTASCCSLLLVEITGVYTSFIRIWLVANGGFSPVIPGLLFATVSTWRKKCVTYWHTPAVRASQDRRVMWLVVNCYNFSAEQSVKYWASENDSQCLRWTLSPSVWRNSV